MAKTIYESWKFPAAKASPPVERFLKLIICPETTGYQNATVLFAMIPPGGTNGPHTHDSDEIMYVVGRGIGIMAGEKTNLETDSVIFAPKGVPHECINTSQTEFLKLFCVYIPPIKLSELLTGLAAKTREFLKENKY